MDELGGVIAHDFTQESAVVLREAFEALAPRLRADEHDPVIFGEAGDAVMAFEEIVSC